MNARANIWALARLGVRAIVSSSAVGAVDPALRPGDLVLPSQLIDRTWGRADTYFDDDVQHLPAADPFDPELRRLAAAALRAAGRARSTASRASSCRVRGSPHAPSPAGSVRPARRSST
ncbi:hypothetical protein [Pseudolysinimonas kribbensis]|uniref:phosphorylase family protein n=1 Tax=Pseudolysinimonas kribbensis TaxID=433641 RepID=UPI0032AFA4B1